MSYVVPEYKKNNFTCPYCGVLAEQKWDYTSIIKGGPYQGYLFIGRPRIQNSEEVTKELAVSTCVSCYKENIWFEGKMIFPKISSVPMPDAEMPEQIKQIYNEARDVFPISPKSSAALLRLALQHLCKELGEKGKNINEDIKELVKKGLPVEIQQALDVVRVAGNNAVHPGNLDLEEDSTNAAYLFNILNLIVDNRIVQPKKISEFYNALPPNILKGIEDRDK